MNQGQPIQQPREAGGISAQVYVGPQHGVVHGFVANGHPRQESRRGFAHVHRRETHVDIRCQSVIEPPPDKGTNLVLKQVGQFVSNANFAA